MRHFTALLLFICSFNLFAQKSPVEWQFQAQELNNNEFLLFCKAKIQKGWYLYSQHIENTPPIPTTIYINANSDFKLLGSIEEKGVLIDEYDEALGKNVKKYANQVSFTAKIKTNKPSVVLDGNVEFMTCDHEKCLPPETIPFQFKLNATRSEQLSIQRNPNTTIANSRRFTNETYNAPSVNIDIPARQSLDLVPRQDNNKNNNATVTHDRSVAQLTSNAERTTVLENSENMVAANIMQYFSKGKEIKQKQILAAQAVEIASEQKIIAAKLAAEEAQKKAQTPTITEAPVDWSFDMISLGEGIYELIANVKIAENWFIYAKNNIGDAPFPLTIQFEENEGIQFLEEQTTEIGQLRTENDPLFNKEVNRYANEITIKRKVKFVDNVPVKGNIKFMAASNQQYLMPTDQQFAYNEDKSIVLKTQASNAGWWIFGALALIAIITSTIVGLTRKIAKKVG